MCDKQVCVDLMSETLFEVFQDCVNNDDVETSVAIYQEWIVDGKDPEDGEYEFMFINDLTTSVWCLHL